MGIGTIPIFCCYEFRERVSVTGKSVLMAFLLIYLMTAGYFYIDWILNITLVNFLIVVFTALPVIALIYVILRRYFGYFGGSE